MTLKENNCELQVNTVFYDGSSWSAIYNDYMSKGSSISLHAQQYSAYGSSVMYVKFQKSTSYLDDPMWSFYTLPDIKVSDFLTMTILMTFPNNIEYQIRYK